MSDTFRETIDTGRAPRALFKTTSSVTPFGTCTANMLYKNSSGVWTADTIVFTLTDVFGVTLASGKRAWAEKYEDDWLIIQGEC